MESTNAVYGVAHDQVDSNLKYYVTFVSLNIENLVVGCNLIYTIHAMVTRKLQWLPIALGYNIWATNTMRISLNNDLYINTDKVHNRLIISKLKNFYNKTIDTKFKQSEA